MCIKNHRHRHIKILPRRLEPLRFSHGPDLFNVWNPIRNFTIIQGYKNHKSHKTDKIFKTKQT